MTTEQQASPADTTHEHQASRTLVKSPPELWAECSDAGSLARHLGQFGEIRITRLEPDTDVAWEGEHASGTVRIEPSAWGTRVTLTAQTNAERATAPPEGVAARVPDDAGEADEVHEGSADPTDSAEEDADATVEKTLEEPDPAVAAEPGVAGRRWAGLRARTRALFSREPAPAEASEPPLAEAAEPSQAKVESVPTPLPDQAEPETVAPLGEPGAYTHPAEPDPVAQERPGVEADPLKAEAILSAALDSLGQAHHRPFSRA